MSEAADGGIRLRASDGRRWTSRAFGMELDLGFDAPGLPRAPNGEQLDPTTVDLAYASSINAAWPPDGRPVGAMGPPERRVMTVDEHPQAGYLISLYPYGRYLVSADGRSVACAPPAVGWWYWQRLLIGQVLPAAAALRGYEVFHASAVALGDTAVAFAGASGLGKSSLALWLMRGGATLVAEDVLTLAEREGRLFAEPGAAMVNLREDESHHVPEAQLAALGEVVGRSHGKVHVIVEREHRSLELGVLFLLERGTSDQAVFEPVDALGIHELYVNSFVTYIYRRDRIVRQLDIAACLARTVRIVRLRVKPGVGARELAAAVERHIGATA